MTDGVRGIVLEAINLAGRGTDARYYRQKRKCKNKGNKCDTKGLNKVFNVI